ncbi:acyltransferase [Pinibacter soli]|uniref:Acyltransferase family protein n=1 Tax=Pinibacter soli TaxID=3044211 RepID=A0ABT6RIH2_9BACT|nr:acyltransferase family protein [Pinibacter soli]MDI3322360.1 acyltransferase family protein [Pinibacter soli]
MQHKDKRLLFADSLRVLATISVILIHVSGPILYKYGHISNSTWWMGNIFDSSARFGVPIFLMLTGALILPRTIEIKSFFQKRISRIVYPFLFWSIIYIIRDLIIKVHAGNDMSVYEIYKFVFIRLKDGASYHLWYVYMIIGIYLIFPVIGKWVLKSSNKEISYYIIIWIIVILLDLPLFDKYRSSINVSYFSGFLGYPILGYLLTTKFKHKRIKLFSILLFISGVLITIIGTYLLTKSSGQFNDYLYSYLSPNIIMASAGLFLFFGHTNSEIKIFSSATNIIGKYSYGIYLSHVFILYFLSLAGITWTFINPFIGIPLTTILCLTISLFTTYLINKIPYGNYVSG